MGDEAGDEGFTRAKGAYILESEKAKHRVWLDSKRMSVRRPERRMREDGWALPVSHACHLELLF